jgi:hypothetical protein
MKPETCSECGCHVFREAGGFGPANGPDVLTLWECDHCGKCEVCDATNHETEAERNLCLRQ